jgi:hypothetical protein
MKLIAAFGAIAILAAGVAAYLLGSAFVSARSAQLDSSRVLDAAGTHSIQIHDSLNAPDFTQATSGSTPDFKAAKRVADDYVSRLDQATTTVTADHDKLAASDGKLRSMLGNPWAMPFRSGLQDQHNKVTSVLSALDAGSSGLQIERDQMRTASALFDSFADFETITDAVGRKDVAGALRAMPSLQQKLKNANQLAQGPNNPPQLQQLLVNLQKTATDLQAFLQAAQRNDLKSANALLPKLDADDKALQAFDEKGFDTYDKKLIQPYRDRYDAGWKAAGFRMAASSTI